MRRSITRADPCWRGAGRDDWDDGSTQRRRFAQPVSPTINPPSSASSMHHRKQDDGRLALSTVAAASYAQLLALDGRFRSCDLKKKRVHLVLAQEFGSFRLDLSERNWIFFEGENVGRMSEGLGLNRQASLLPNDLRAHKIMVDEKRRKSSRLETRSASVRHQTRDAVDGMFRVLAILSRLTLLLHCWLARPRFI